MKFGPAIKQSKITSRKQRLHDTSVHATSRPWHTSAAGIKININAMGQIADSAGPIARKYLNRMTLSELAQKKRGLDAPQLGGGQSNPMARAMAAGLRSSVKGRLAYGAPNQETINRWHSSLLDQEKDLSGRAAEYAGTERAEGPTGYSEQVDAIRSARKKLRDKRRHGYF